MSQRVHLIVRLDLDVDDWADLDDPALWDQLAEGLEHPDLHIENLADHVQALCRVDVLDVLPAVPASPVSDAAAGGDQERPWDQLDITTLEEPRPDGEADHAG